MKKFGFLHISLIVILALAISTLTTPILFAQAGGVSIPAQINKSFTPLSIVAGQTSVLSITVYNPNSFQLINTAWADDLVGVQAGLFVANPASVTNTCGGIVTATPGATTVSLSGGTVPAISGLTFGSCTVTLNVSSVTAGNLINTIPTNAVTATDPGGTIPVTNSTPASATLQVGSVQPPSLSKSFTPNTVAAGQISQLAIVITNNDTVTALTNTTLTDLFPTNVVVASPVTTSLTGCGSGTLTDSGGSALVGGSSASVKLNNGTVAKSSTCTIHVNVVSLTQGTYINDIPAGPGGSGSIQTQQGVTNGSQASAQLNVQQTVSVIKSFAPSTINAGGTSTLTITLQNPTGSAYTVASSGLTDTLPSPLLLNGSPTTTCAGGTLSTPTTSEVVLSGGSIPASANPGVTNGTCTITVPVITPITTPATTYTNSIPIGGLTTTQGISNTVAANANLIVNSVSISKVFAPTSFPDGNTATVLTITLTNPTATAFTVASPGLTDTMPGPITVVNGTATTTCTGGTASTPDATHVSLSGGIIPAGGNCNIKVNVTAPLSASSASYTNTIPASALTTTQGATNASPATAPISVTSVSVSKLFSPATITAGGTSTLTVTLTNPTASDYTVNTLTDTLPSPLTVVNGSAATTCAGGTASTPASNQVSLSGGTIPANGACTLTVTVNAPVNANGAYTNTIPANALTTTEGAKNSSAASTGLTVNPAVTVSKSFSLTPILYPGGSSTLTITLTNNTSTALAINTPGISDTLPNANLNFVTTSGANTCGGTTVVTTTKVQLNGGTLPANSSCTITATVIAVAGVTANYTNTIVANALSTTSGTASTAATAPIGINASLPPTVTKTFNPTTIALGNATTIANGKGDTLLQINVKAPSDTNLTAFSITDNLPAGMTVTNVNTAGASTPAAKNGSCQNGALTATTGSSTITWTGGTINANATCTITVYVTSSTAGTLTNTIQPTDISSTPNRPIAGNVTANLTASSYTVSKAFYPTTVAPNGISTLTITLTNDSTSALTSAALTDTLPGTTTDGLIIATPPNASTTCGGTVTATAGSQTISLSGGTIPAQVGAVPGICTIIVNVQGKGAVNSYINNIATANVSAKTPDNTTINPTSTTPASLNIANLAIQVVKGFNPLTVFGGSSSTLSVQLTNPNSGVLTGISFTDVMHDSVQNGDIVIANPPNFSVGTCGGTLTGTIGSNTFTFNGGTLAGNTSCTLTLSTTMNVNGNLTNTIPVGAVTTTNGASDTQAASASLTNLPGVSLSKFFAPNSIPAGGSSTLTITLKNTGNTPLTGMGLIDDLSTTGTLPNGLEIANPSNASTTCKDPNVTTVPTLTATPGTQLIQLGSGSMPGSTIATCTITVSVTGNVVGNYTNTIPTGALTDDQGAQNQLPASDTLTVTNSSALGDFVWNDTNHNGIQDAGESGIPNVTVTLYGSDGTTVLGTTTTDANGLYHFTGLAAGTYYVGFTTPSGYVFSPQYQGSDTSKDSNASVTTGKSDAVTLTAGQTDDTIDAGMYQPTAPTSCTNAITGVVFNDANANGIQDSGEQGLSGVLVSLFDQNNNAVTYTTTDANGNYSFSHLAPGIYKVVETDLKGYSSTTLNTVSVPLGCTNSNHTVNFGDQKGTVTIVDPAITKYGDPSAAKFGDNITFVLTVGNNGTATATNVVLTDTLPNFLDIVSITISPNPGNKLSWSPAPSGFTISLGDVTPTDVYVITVVTKVNSLGVPPGGQNNASISTDSKPEPVFNDSASAPITIQGTSSGGGGNGGATSATQLPQTGFAPGVVTPLSVQPSNKMYSSYGDVWLEIPKLNVQIPIVGVPEANGTWDVSWLGDQAGWLQNSAFPSWSGNSVLTGHVYMSNGLPGPFVNLRQLNWGDQIILHVYGVKYIYQVRKNINVLPSDLSPLKHESLPWVTLITCEGYNQTNNSYAYRVAVQAVLVDTVSQGSGLHSK